MNGYVPYTMQDFATEQKRRAEAERVRREAEWARLAARSQEEREADEAKLREERRNGAMGGLFEFF